jgi:N,N'-diacetyllegionaminate synthase
VNFTLTKTFVIAEMANSHEGNLATAKQITEKAAYAGADAIKYQKFTADELANPSHENYSLYKKLEMKNSEWVELIKFAKSLKLKVFLDIFGLCSALQAKSFGVDGYKIHSADATNLPLLKFLSNQKKPILISTAGCTLNEIYKSISTITMNHNLVLMHGFQGYPTKLNDLDLHRLKSLKERFGMPIGLSDHVSGNSNMATLIPLFGIMLGASVIEKHITLDRKKKGLDYYSALNPTEFSNLVSLIRKTEKTLGTEFFILSKNEIKYRNLHKKFFIANKSIKKDSKLNLNMFDFKRVKTSNGLTTLNFKKTFAKKSISKDTVLNSSFVDDQLPKIAAVVACRVHSSRLFAKQLQIIENTTILEMVIDQLKTSTLIDDIVLAISDRKGNEVFIEFAKQNNLKFILGDDKDVLKRLIDGAKIANAEIIFRITPENPYIYWEGIDQIIKEHISGNFDFSNLVDLPLGSGYEVINLNSLEISHQKGKDKHRSELCSLYINENQKKFKINRFYIPKKLQRSEIRLTVDTPQDLILARIIYKKLKKKNHLISLNQIIPFLDKNPELLKINTDIPLGVSRIW